MKIIKVKDYEELSKMAADFVRNLLEKKPDNVL
jgi:6-phosphogluconolactonase/glucosamine-6-phosphate isomerase/deaminase